MSSMSTFGTFTMARLGIFVAQHALNTTGNNISNINTEGYTRQKLDQTSMTYGAADRYQSRFDVRSNGGVLATGVEQMRDQYLDIRYRNEMTRVGEMDAKLGGLKQLSVIFDEVGKGEDGEGVLEARFNNLTQQLETMLQDYNVGRNTSDSIVREAAEELVTQFNDYAKQLETLESNMVAEFNDNLSTVNTTLTKIRDLNETIRRAQIFGGNAATQRDERNLLIDDLSKRLGINVIYDMESMGDGVEVEKLRIETKGDPELGIPSRTLIDGIYGAQLSVVQKGEDEPPAEENGQQAGAQVYGKKSADNDNFDIVVSQLTDSRGISMAKQPNPLEKMISSLRSIGYPSEVPENGNTPPAAATAFKTAADALAAANLMNTDPTFYSNPTAVEGETPVKAYYYHVADARGNSPNEETSDNYNASLPKTTPPYYIHIHETDYTPRDTSGKTEAEIEEIRNAELEERAAYADTNGHETETVDGETVTKYSQRFAFADVKTMYGTRLGDTELSGSLQAQRELLTEEGEYATDETIANVDPEAGAKRGIPYYRKALDTLARTFAEEMNKANKLTNEIAYETVKDGPVSELDAAALKSELGVDKESLMRDESTDEFVSIKGSDGATYTRDEKSGKYLRTVKLAGSDEITTSLVSEETAKQFFKPTEDYEKYFTARTYTRADKTENGRIAGNFYADDDGTSLTLPSGFPVSAGQNSITLYSVNKDDEQYFGGNLFSVSGTNDFDGTSGNSGDGTKITAANISISYKWAHGSMHVLRSIDPDAKTTSRASDNLVHIVAMLNDKQEFTTGTDAKGTTYFRGTFQEMLTDTIAGTLAKDSNITSAMLDNYTATADTLYVDRDAVMGVDLNDEAMNMMQFQKAYSAACRLMTTYDEMLEKLINGTAV